MSTEFNKEDTAPGRGPDHRVAEPTPVTLSSATRIGHGRHDAPGRPAQITAGRHPGRDELRQAHPLRSVTGIAMR